MSSSSLLTGAVRLPAITTNVPPLDWTDRGIALPEESAILTGVIQDFQNAFDNQLKFYNANGDFLLSTPQGQLVSSIAAMISDRNRLLAFYVNQIDPSYATGRMQDAIGRLYFIERQPAENTKVIGICNGSVGVQIAAGTKVQDNVGNLYQADDTYTIGDNGTVNVTFVCTKEGPIACPANSLQMYQLIPGWDSVTNPVEGQVGQYVESQAQFEDRRRLSVAKNSVNSTDSIMASLLDLKDTDNNNQPVCNDAYVIENFLGDFVSKNGITLKPHSIYVCVDALDSDKNQQLIGRAIFDKKPPGCDMNGDHQVTIVDASGLYSTPPEYVICYSYANRIPIKVRIVLARPQFLPSDAENQIKDAIYKHFTGSDGSVRPRIGSQVLASSFYSPVQGLGTWVKIISLHIGRDNADGDSIQMNINEMPVLDKNDIQVVFNG